MVYRTGPTIQTAGTRPLRDFRPRCLNLGCGRNIEPTDNEYVWYNLDKFANPGVDVVWDLEMTPLPFPDDFFDFIKASHVLEHIRNWIPLMKDLHRILKPRGCLHIRVPEGRCRAAMADPTHVNFFVPESWLHWDKDTDLGFETEPTSAVGYLLKWNEQVEHHRPAIDDGRPGNYYTELMVDLEKDGEPYPWEVKLLPRLKETERKFAA